MVNSRSYNEDYYVGLVDQNIQDLITSNYSGEKSHSNKFIGFLTEHSLQKNKLTYTRSKTLINIIVNSNYKNKLEQSETISTITPDIINISDCTSKNSELNLNKIITYSSIIELLNIATKTHDLIGNNNKINTKYIGLSGLETDKAILLGDLIYTIAFEQMISLNDQNILEHFSSTTQNMALAEAKLCSIQSNYENSASAKDCGKQINIAKYWPLFNSIIFFCNNYDIEWQPNTKENKKLQNIPNYIKYQFNKYLESKALETSY